jgi:hypothetical protein
MLRGGPRNGRNWDRPLGLLRGASLLGGLAVAAVSLARCDPNLVIGADAPDGAAVPEGGLTAIDFPWSTSFEDGDPDYQAPQGYCYESFGGDVAIVGAPPDAHSGSHVAAFSVVAETGAPFNQVSQVRCVRQGVLPQSAYYGAWYYVPQPVTVLSVGAPVFSLWNLFHFQGADSPSGQFRNLWDLSVASQPDGALHIYGYDFLRTQTLDASLVPPIPIGTWVHLEVFLKRSDADAGEFAIYQDGQLALDLQGIQTDPTVWGQFYVGSLAYALMPPNVTVYVDDVSITGSL